MNNDLILILNAASFAADKHRGQRRKDAEASPYINHPLALADILAREGGVEDATVIAAALLHDTVEDTETSIEEIEAKFGKRVASVVAEVTDDKSLPKEERKRLQVVKSASKSPGAKLVKLADKTANLRDLVATPPADWSADRRTKYFEWSREVVAGLRGTNASLEAAFDEAYQRGIRSTDRSREEPISSASHIAQFSRETLTETGFSGWLSFAEARKSDLCPRTGGVYVVRYSGAHPPSFLRKSSGGWFKDRDPSVAAGALQANWVEDAEVIYIGKADELRRRVRQFADFGIGKPIGHWGGRLIWHLPAECLEIAWCETHGRSPLAVEAELIAQFRDEYGKPPFANNPQMLGR